MTTKVKPTETVSDCCGGLVVPYYPDAFKPSVNTCSICGKKCNTFSDHDLELIKEGRQRSDRDTRRGE